MDVSLEESEGFDDSNGLSVRDHGARSGVSGTGASAPPPSSHDVNELLDSEDDDVGVDGLDGDLLAGRGGVGGWSDGKPSPSWVSQALADFQSAIKYVWTDTRRHKRNCCVGTFTVFLVVAFIGLLQASIARSPIIFMKLGEDEVGDFDFTVTPSAASVGSVGGGGGFQSPLLNFTAFDEAMGPVAEVVGSSPRWLTFMRLHNAQDPALNGSAILLAFDHDREQQLGIGRSWAYPRLQPGQAHVSAVLLRRLKVAPRAGQNVTLVVDLLGTLQQLSGQSVASLLGAGGSSADGGDAGGLGGALAGLGNATLASLLDQAAAAAGGGPTGEFALKASLSAGWSLARQQLPGLQLPDWDSLPWNVPLLELAAGAVQSGLTLRANVTVSDAIEAPGGKYPTVLGNVVVLEARHIHQLIDDQLEQVRNGLRELADSGFLVAAAESFLNLTDTDFRQDVALVDDLLVQLEQFDLNSFALSAVGVYRDRLSAYVRDGPGISQAMIELTDAIARGLGPAQASRVSLQTPLASTLGTLYFIRLFLDQIFTFVSAVLVGLGALLIYSLLLANVEEKTYEYGMLRALGMRHYVLIELLVVQALLFAVPGIVTGLGAAFVLYVPAAAVLSYFVDVPLDLSMSPGSVITGVVLGLVMPAVANVGPIRRALRSTLRDALDVYHDARTTTTVTIVRLARVGLSPWQLVVASLLVVMGFVVYYLVPFAFIFNNLPLFLLLLTLILLGMLVGFSVVAQVLEPLAERLFLRLLLLAWPADRRQLGDLVRKSLHAHAGRNRKTAAMFTVALAFIVFVGVSFALQGVSIRSNVQLGVGADIVVLAPSLRSALQEAPMRAYLDGELARRRAGAPDAHVLGYTFQTFPLTDLGFVQSTHLSNLAGVPDRRVRVVAVDPNYLDVTYSQYFRASEEAPSLQFNRTAQGEPDVIQSLYANAGRLRLASEVAAAGGSVNDPPYVPPSIGSAGIRERSGTLNPDGSIVRQSEASVYLNYTDVAMSEALRLEASIDTSTPMYLRIQFARDVDSSSLNLYLLCKAQAMIRKLAGELGYSSYRQLSQGSQLLVSLPEYKRMLRMMRTEGAGYGLVAAGLIGGGGGPSSSASADVDSFEPPKAKLFVRLDDGASSLDREDVINSLRTFVADDVTQVLDTLALVDSTALAIEVLNVFFVVVLTLALVLCFFVLWLSFTANLRENSWEFGVLRALGLTASQVVRVYVYEACALILSSLFLGTIIGLAQASSLTLQFNLFTELPFEMQFPGAIYVFVVCMSFTVAILGAWFPARQFKRKQIALVLKGL